MNFARTHLRSAVAGLAFAAALCTGTFAQDAPSASHLETARSAIEAIGATRQFDSILISAALTLKSQLIQDNPDQETIISATVDETALSLAGRRGDLENEAARIYAALFTEEELAAIAEFYQSEAGKKLIAAGPTATRNVLRAADIWSRGVARDLAEATGAALRERIGSDAPNVSAPDGTPQAPQTQ